jgi:hypothetical protein
VEEKKAWKRLSKENATPDGRVDSKAKAVLVLKRHRYDSTIPTRFLAPIDCSQIPALFCLHCTEKKEKQISSYIRKFRNGAVAKSYMYGEGLPNI